jgi:hypothetical protein
VIVASGLGFPLSFASVGPSWGHWLQTPLFFGRQLTVMMGGRKNGVWGLRPQPPEAHNFSQGIPVILCVCKLSRHFGCSRQ